MTPDEAASLRRTLRALLSSPAAEVTILEFVCPACGGSLRIRAEHAAHWRTAECAADPAHFSAVGPAEFEGPPPNRCPKCSTVEDVVPIVYGLIRGEAIESLRDNFALGGCIVGPERWDCRRCYHAF